MNPSFEAFVDPPDGFHEKPGTRSNREGQFSPPEARMVVESRMQILGLCSFDARRKSRFWFLATNNGSFSERLKKMKSRRKLFLGGRKSYLAAEHITRRRRKKKKKVEVFPLGRRKILLLRPFLELPEFQTFFCPFSVLRIFGFLPLRHLLALPEFVSFFFRGL